MQYRSARLYLSCLMLGATLGCGADGDKRGAGEFRGQKLSLTPPLDKGFDDFVPRYLSPPVKDKQLQLAAPPLAEVDSIRLQVRDLPLPTYISAVAASDAGFFAVHDPTKQIWHFDSEGKFVKRFGSYPEHKTRIRLGLFLEASDSDERLYLADEENGVLVLGQDGSFIERLPNIKYAYSVAGASGHLIVGISNHRGPYWTSLADRMNPSLFFSQRRPLLPPGQEFLTSIIPHSSAAFDNDGNIYVGTRAVPQIRKFKADTAYVGDFRIQTDPILVAPPNTIPDMWRQIREIPFSLAQWLCVASDHVIIQFSHPSRIDEPSITSVHFYTLDGQPAFAQFRTEYYLKDCSSEGQLYFMDYGNPENPVIKTYHLNL